MLLSFSLVKKVNLLNVMSCSHTWLHALARRKIAILLPMFLQLSQASNRPTALFLWGPVSRSIVQTCEKDFIFMAFLLLQTTQFCVQRVCQLI